MPNQHWLNHDLTGSTSITLNANFLIHLAPIWLLPNVLTHLTPPYPEHIIAISSTSRFTKQSSNSSYEQQIVQKLIDGEHALEQFATTHQIAWTILRPTLVYAQKGDKNISIIAQFIRRFKCFPLIGKAQGLRQPIHAADIANACVSVLNNPVTFNKAYNIGGGETLTYKAMVIRIFQALNQKTLFIPIPTLLLKGGLVSLKLLPRFKHLTPNMADRMNEDLVFNSTEASKDFDFNPRPFQPLT